MISKKDLSKEFFAEVQRYSDSTLIVTSISELIGKNSDLGMILFLEKELKKIDESFKEKLKGKDNSFILKNFKDKLKTLQKIEVDLIIKEKAHNIVEFKTSISPHQDEIEKTLNQIKERDTDLLSDLQVIEVSKIIFICHKDDLNTILSRFKEGKLDQDMKRKVFFLEWIQGDNKDHEPCLYLEFKEGFASEIPKIVSEIKKGGKTCFSTNNLIFLRHKKKFIFTGKKPPIPYLLANLYHFFSFYLHPILIHPNVPDEYLIPDDLASLRDSFVEKYQNAYSKPKLGWFYEGITYFQKLKFLRIDGEKVYFNIKNIIKNRREKDWDRFFSAFCASERIEELERKSKKEKQRKRWKGVDPKKAKVTPLDKFF